MRKLKVQNRKGITLIALIITIIVLLILAGVSISFVVGDNGILSQAGNAKTETDIAEEQDFVEMAYSGASIVNHGNGTTVEILQNELNKLAGVGKTEVTAKEDGTFNVKFLDTGREYTVGKVFINWNAILADANEGENYKKYKYSEETTSEYIAIGTDGKPVDMELWDPTLNEDGTWALGVAESYNLAKNVYLGEITNDGKIVGCVPQYIYNTTEKKFTPVTIMRSTFAWNDDLIIAPDIPDTVTDMDGCFAVCNALEEVLGLPANLTNIPKDMFFNCGNLTNIIIPENVTSIELKAFQSCKRLISITIPESVTSIGDYAFDYCTGLTSITLPDNVTSIGNNAFSCTGLISITIPESVISIGTYAFNNCPGLISITIPESVKSIGTYAFRLCTGLESITVDENNTIYDSRENSNTIIKTLTNTLLYGCKNTTIPSSVTSIESNAFYNCTGLESITIPESVTSIGNTAFSGCTGLTSITIPDSVTSIGDYAFSSCTGLTSITIPSSVTKI